jgi:hypothetical protein
MSGMHILKPRKQKADKDLSPEDNIIISDFYHINNLISAPSDLVLLYFGISFVYL